MTVSSGQVSNQMDDRVALHTAARRYCDDRFSEWAQRYSDLEAKEAFKGDYSPEAYGIFPRYRLDKAIRVEVERLSPHSGKTLVDLRGQLIRAASIAEERLKAEFKNTIALKALREEAESYKAYIKTLRDEDLKYIEGLPFRRVLAPDESAEIRAQLGKTWGIGEGYWFPLRMGEIPANILAFHVEYFRLIAGYDLLREVVGAREIETVFELNEFGADLDEPDCEIELSILSPEYLFGGEQYCTSVGVDWVAYASHESSVTIAGDWLVEAFKERHPECTDRTYGGPFSTSDLRGTWK